MLETYHQLIFLEIYGSSAFSHADHFYENSRQVFVERLMVLASWGVQDHIYTWHSHGTAIWTVSRLFFDMTSVKNQIAASYIIGKNHPIAPWLRTSCNVPGFHPFLMKHFCTEHFDVAWCSNFGARSRLSDCVVYHRFSWLEDDITMGADRLFFTFTEADQLILKIIFNMLRCFFFFFNRFMTIGNYLRNNLKSHLPND